MDSEQDFRLTKEDLEQLLSAGINDYHVTNLTEPGDNNGSTMLAIKVTLKTGKVKLLVAKTFPSDPVAVRGFQSPISMRKEIDMYLVLCPEFQKIQEDHAVPPPLRQDMFCTCLAARATRRRSDTARLADANSVILLENLKIQGYSSPDRVIGMDMSHTELVVSQLAKFHATLIAVKLTKPLLFRNKIMSALAPIKFRMDSKDLEEKTTKDFLEVLEQRSPVCKENFDKLSKLFYEDIDYRFGKYFRPPTEPFATIVHNDLWTNNIMFKYSASNSEKPVALKLLDFQGIYYGSPAIDIVFFLFTSTEDGIVEKKLDYLLKLYHESFVQWLNLLGCSTHKYSWENFSKELSIFSALELPHILLMLNVVMAHKEQIEHRASGQLENDVALAPEVNDDIIRRASQTVSTFSQQGWL